MFEFERSVIQVSSLYRNGAWLLALIAGLFAPLAAAEPPRSLIREPVDDSSRTVLTGNTHPLAQPRFDAGPAPDALPMNRILLVLHRSPEQEVALEKLAADQLNPASQRYHQWLTPQQFGREFGPSDTDIGIVRSWLEAHGFTVNRVSNGRTVIDFSGTARQVADAFRSPIHRYLINGHQYWANSSDPQIPTALAPVVAGFVSLNSFPLKPPARASATFSKPKGTGASGPVKPEFTVPVSRGDQSSSFAIGPYDLAAIYNLLPLWSAGIDGAGVSIAIPGYSNINLDDVRRFRSLFGLPAKDPVIVLDGAAPANLGGIDESETVGDVTWSGAAAPGATIDLVLSPSTNSTSDIDLELEFAVDQNLAPILSASVEACELYLGTAGNVYVNLLWQQAAAQGMTALVASSDSGSAGCDNFDETSPAQYGFAVNGFASTPYNVAVGGTDFNDLFTAASYWNVQNNSTTEASVRGYIPEMAWNNSCVSPEFTQLGFGSDAETTCNNPMLADFQEPLAGSGGKSNCTTVTGSELPVNCSGGYPKPSWQKGPGVPNDQARDLPDVSLFASNGLWSGSFYVLCLADQDPDKSNAPCDLNSPYMHFQGAGGTSTSTPAFAGIMALLNQVTNSRQGNVNAVLYELAARQSSASCDSTATLSSSCIFNDVTLGTNAVPCATASPNCVTNLAGDKVGVLPGYNAGVAYDLATGWGSVNAFNLVTARGWALTNSTGCGSTISPGSAAFAAAGGSGSIAITAPAGCSWNVSSPAGWVTFNGSASGSGNGSVRFQVAPNSGAARAVQLTAAGLSFLVAQTAASSAALSVFGSMAQLASGGGWDTTLTLVNTGSAAGEALVDFFDNNGVPLSLPVTFPQITSASGPLLASTLDQPLNPYALLLIDTRQSGNPNAQIGSAQVFTAGAIGGFAIFQYASTGQEAVVPLETQNAPSYLLAFDNTGVLSTGVALANVAASPAAIPITIRDDTGAQLATGTINLPALGHTSFTLTAGYAATAGKRGTIEFDTPPSGQISALGLRGNGAALTTLPVLANVTPGGGSMAQVASGGGWQTTFTLVNAGTSAAQVQLNFFDGNGNAIPLPLSYVQTGKIATASTISQTLAAGATLIVLTQGGNAVAGWAQLQTTGNVSGFAIFRYNPSGQEAVVPLETGSAAGYVLAFDNTNGLVTGLALANVSTQPASVPVTVRDDTGATIGIATINLPAQGHTSFVLTDQYAFTAGLRGTVEFDAPTGAAISVLGLRATPTGVVTTVPAIAK